MAEGLHSFVYREVRELTSAGVEVHLFPTKVGPGPYLPREDWPVHRASPSRVAFGHLRMLICDPRRYLETLREALAFGALVDFALAGYVSQRVLRLGLDLIHCHFGDHKLFVGYFAARMARRPATVTIHAYELYNNPNPALFRRALERVDVVVTISEFNRKVLADRWGLKPDRILVIPLFADLPAEMDHPLRDDGKVVILTVARLVEKKGHRTLLAALAKLPQNYEAWIVGSGPLDIAGMADRMGVGNRVVFMGRLSDERLREAYAGATIFCLPSETSELGDKEGIPVALMEAMAHGLPVVATRHAGVPELVEEPLVEEDDPAGLARALVRLASDPELRSHQGRRNREVVASRFSRRNVLLLKAVFERLSDGTRQS